MKINIKELANLTQEEKRIRIAELFGKDGDFLNDLNAMAEVEQAMTPAQKAVYGEILAREVGGFFNEYWGGNAPDYGVARGFGKLVSATATQRADTFLRVMAIEAPPVQIRSRG